MGKGNDPNCATTAAAAPAFGATAGLGEDRAQARAFQLQAHRAQHARLLDEHDLGPEWGLYDKHVERLSHPALQGAFKVLSETLTDLFPDQVRTVGGQWLSAEQLAVSGADEDDGGRTYLAVKLTDPDTAQLTSALQALVQFESGDGVVAQQVREAEAFGRVQAVHRNIRVRATKRCGVIEDGLPDNWVQQLVDVLRDQSLGDVDDHMHHGIVRRQAGVHTWQNAWVPEESVRAACVKLGFLAG